MNWRYDGLDEQKVWSIDEPVYTQSEYLSKYGHLPSFMSYSDAYSFLAQRSMSFSQNLGHVGIFRNRQ